LKDWSMMVIKVRLFPVIRALHHENVSHFLTDATNCPLSFRRPFSTNTSFAK